MAVYRPIPLKFAPSSTSSVSTMGQMGVNKAIAPQFLDTRFALDIVNYEIEGVGRLIKRNGIEKIFEVVGNYPITMLKKWGNVWVFGYNTTVAVYFPGTGIIEDVKTDFASGTKFEGVPYGEYFFVCDGVGKVYRLVLSGLIYTATEVVDSPEGAVGLNAIKARLYAWKGDTVYYSSVDDGTNPPFTDWTVSTDVSKGGKVNYRNAGDVRAVVPLGEHNVVFSDRGFFAFKFDTIDNAGALRKVETVTKYQEDFGGSRAAINTPIGVFYVNEAGLWHMTALGHTNVPYSKQEVLVSRNLGNRYFEDVSLKEADIAYDIKKSCVYIACARESEANNLLIVFNVDYKAFYKFTGWNVNRFMRIDTDYYIGASNKTAVYKLFSGFTDDGQTISTRYYQELKLGDLETRQDLHEMYTQGFLSQSSKIKVRFDTYNKRGILVNDKAEYEWTAQYSVGGMDSYNSGRYSRTPYNGDIEKPGMVECFDGVKTKIRNFNRIRVNITSGDKVPHEITWIKLNARVKGRSRRRSIVKIN